MKMCRLLNYGGTSMNWLQEFTFSVRFSLDAHQHIYPGQHKMRTRLFRTSLRFWAYWLRVVLLVYHFWLSFRVKLPSSTIPTICKHVLMVQQKHFLYKFSSNFWSTSQYQTWSHTWAFDWFYAFWMRSLALFVVSLQCIHTKHIILVSTSCQQIQF